MKKSLWKKNTAENASGLAGQVEGLPASVTTGQSYPVTFSFTNNSSSSIASTKFTSDYSSDFSTNSDTCSSLSQLAAGASCSISGSLTPSSSGPITLTNRFSSNDNTLIELSTGTVASSGSCFSFEITEPLPATATLEGQEEVSVSSTVIFTNNCTQAVQVGTTELNLNPSPSPDTVTAYPVDYCISTSVPPGGTCKFSFSLTIKVAGTYTATLVLPYSGAEGSPISIPQVVTVT